MGQYGLIFIGHYDESVPSGKRTESILGVQSETRQKRERQQQMVAKICAYLNKFHA